MMIPISSMPGGAPLLVLGIVLAAFVSEDGATITAATLAASSVLDARLAFLGAFAGLWAGDLGVYFAARLASSTAPSNGRLSRWLAKNRNSAPAANNRHGWALAASRFFPGTRLPAYISAGIQRMAVSTFAWITALSAAAWVSLVFAFFRFAPARAATAKRQFAILGACGLVTFAALYLWKAWSKTHRNRLQLFFAKWRRWEFWPAWFFYTPVALFCAWLSLRYRGISLPTIANLNQKNGGIVGESKIEILRKLMRTSPEFTADAHAIESGSVERRIEVANEIRRTTGIDFPFVLKPDTAQRGAGFRKINSQQQLEDYLRVVAAPLVLQRYVSGPHEAGIFYYRFPQESTGHILGITRKRFPFVTGNGSSTLQQLIEQDPRARLIAKTYLARFGASANRIPGAGEVVRLVEAGNHCQGCIFEDGHDLNTEELLLAFDSISKSLPGFFIGRYDIRYFSEEELRQGKGFTIIELNGAASEATNIYDAKNSIWHAYATLYRQWQLVYAIGAANRSDGARPVSAWRVWQDWKSFSAQACEFPIAD